MASNFWGAVPAAPPITPPAASMGDASGGLGGIPLAQILQMFGIMPQQPTGPQPPPGVKIYGIGAGYTPNVTQPPQKNEWQSPQGLMAFMAFMNQLNKLSGVGGNQAAQAPAAAGPVAPPTTTPTSPQMAPPTSFQAPTAAQSMMAPTGSSGARTAMRGLLNPPRTRPNVSPIGGSL